MGSNLWQHPASDDEDEHEELLDDKNHRVIVHLRAVIHSSQIQLIKNEHEELLNDKNHHVFHLGAVIHSSKIQLIK
jgi:hypothetical protein